MPGKGLRRAGVRRRRHPGGRWLGKPRRRDRLGDGSRTTRLGCARLHRSLRFPLARLLEVEWLWVPSGDRRGDLPLRTRPDTTLRGDELPALAGGHLVEVIDVHDRALLIAKLGAVATRAGISLLPVEEPVVDAHVVDELPMIPTADGLLNEPPDHDLDGGAGGALRAGFARGSSHGKCGLLIERQIHLPDFLVGANRSYPKARHVARSGA